uniref:Uncharacterized protein n=1 Tax=viral metagenome TaxID=1070528 RepID=A0A6H1ZR10_9ZZZZ
MWPNIIKVTKDRGHAKINIPITLARETGIDKSEYVLITKSANNKLEVKRYDSEKDIAEYIQSDIDELNRSS